MADFAPPTGPPPPKVPEGWVARWNDQYHEWFYVNTYTKKSQWEKPTEPAVDPNRHDDSAPPGPPPSYTPGSGPAPSDSKSASGQNNPFINESTKPGAPSTSSHSIDEDERLARQLQEEEDARARGVGAHGAAASYGGTPVPPQGYSSYPDQLPPRGSSGTPADKAKGLLGKFFGGKSKQHGSSGYPGQQYPPQQAYGGYGSPPPQQGYYGGPPPGQYGGYGAPPQQYGGYGGYPQGQGGYYGGQPAAAQKKPGGMGAAGGAALGLGAGLIGGALIADAIDDHQQEAYMDGYQDGNDGDFGGGDDFGGDF
ncbi:hypothetical protein F4776DRAFT_630235 [Hypoxylon sp. NC0597]|nr:hypothetical protein F4776DRAFT_630235 [Hypoxylon sp. NC0597]